jgi:hypothetical protein
MARARNKAAEEPQEAQPEAAQPEPAPASDAAIPEPKTKTLKYTGPPNQAVVGIDEELVAGESYEVPEELADSLVAGSAHWEE